MSQANPFISIIVPTRDRVDWLRRCLNGIAEQTYKEYEVVIVDDGSSAEVISAYKSMMTEFGDRFRLIKANSQPERRLGCCGQQSASRECRLIFFKSKNSTWR